MDLILCIPAGHVGNALQLLLLPEMPGVVQWGDYSACGICAFCRAGHENLLPLAAAIPIIPEVEEYPLERANETLARLKAGQIHGAAVLRISA